VDDVGIAYATLDGPLYSAGAATTLISLQSIAKLFALVIVLAHDGESVWQRVGYGCSTGRYNSLSDLDLGNRPSNPFVNAGALVITDRLHSLYGNAAQVVANFVGEQSGSSAVSVNTDVAGAELAHSQRNTALVYALAESGFIDNPPAVVLEDYLAQCAIQASSIDLARTGLFLADSGRGVDGRTVLPPLATRQVNGLLVLAGTYDASADLMYRTGLPAKSGIGGGILAAAPHHGAICAWSPRLDSHGNSIAATVALETFVDQAALSLY
jgi:glutaminase